MLNLLLSIVTFLCLIPTTSREDHIMVFLSPGSLKAEVNELNELHKRHLSYLKELSSEVKLEFRGSFDDGGEVLLFHGSSVENVKSFVKNDPAVENNFFRYELYKTEIRTGRPCNVDDSTFVKYTFIKFTSHITKYNVQDVPQLLKAHDDYIKELNQTGNVIAEGVFSNSDGGFLVMQGSLAREVIMNDPTVPAGFTIPNIETIWMLKDSFCD